jgi:hypothetical protein
MTQSPPVREPLLELYDALAQYQLRDAGAEVAAAIAHAVGTPLNVISGRAELIRHDPSNALAQVTRIEEQVKKLATGLRQLVDYLAQPEPLALQRPGGAKRAADAPAARVPSSEAGPAVTEPVVVDARAVLDDLSRLVAPLASSGGVELAVEAKALEGARVDRWHALGTLNALVTGALRHAAGQQGKGPANGRTTPPVVRVAVSIAEQGVMFELEVPSLTLIEGWQLEHFQARPAAADCPEFFRTMSICAAVVRGHGGRLLAERSPNGDAVVLRFSCRNEGA